MVVATPPPPLPSRTEQPLPVGPFAGSPDSRVFDALRAADARIDLTPGRPDLSAFPRTAWLRAERAVLAELSSADLGYGDPRGAPGCGARSPTGWRAAGASLWTRTAS